MGDAADSAPAVQEHFMRAALEMANRSMAAGGPPVGACLVRGDEIIARGHNAVIADLDITAHAELVVIREACRSQRALSLDGCALYVTVQPCPMCFASSWYAGIRKVFYAAPIESLQNITGHELLTTPGDLFAGQQDQPELVSDVLRAEAESQLAQWQEALTG